MPLCLGLFHLSKPSKVTNAHEARERQNELTVWAIQCGALAILDVVLLPFFFLPLLVPTRTAAFVSAHVELYRDLFARYRGQTNNPPRWAVVNEEDEDEQPPPYFRPRGSSSV